jgi:hypothetical protein
VTSPNLWSSQSVRIPASSEVVEGAEGVVRSELDHRSANSRGVSPSRLPCGPSLL